MALNSIVGLELHSSTEIEALVPVLVVEDSLVYATDVVRPEVKIAEERVKVAESSLRLNDARYKPQIYVGVEGTYSSPGYNFHTDMDPNYVAYAKLSIPIFEWGKRRSEKRASQGQVGVASDQLNLGEGQRGNWRFRPARLNLLQAQEQVKLTENSLEKARENEIKALERYSEGTVSILEVIDAQTYRENSQLNYVQAKVAAQGYYSSLIKALNAYGSL